MAALHEWDHPYFCAAHGVIEYVHDPYRVCGECWHRFTSEADLLDQDAANRAVRLASGDDVYLCPVCTHDW
jgi:hypothetical protein